MKLCRHSLGALVSSTFFILLVACGSPGPPVAPSLELPKVVTDLRAMRKGEKVYLAWTVPSHTTDSATVRHLGPTLVCRSLEVAFNQCGIPVGQMSASQLMPTRPKQATTTTPAPIQANYVDILPSELGQQNPTGMVSYAVETQNKDRRSAGLSNQVQVLVAPTLPAPRSLKAEVTAQGVVLHWTGTLPARDIGEINFLERIYRREKGSNQDARAGEVPLGGTAEGTFTDHGFEWEKTYEYRVTMVTQVSRGTEPIQQIEGEDSAPAEVETTDVFPPAVPSGVQAVFSGVGQQPFIDLTWAPVTDSDLAGYNVYRHEQLGSPIKINRELVKTPAFRDNGVEPGHNYFYSVSSVDLRANESVRSQETSEKVP